jgi:hypothetical protein
MNNLSLAVLTDCGEVIVMKGQGGADLKTAYFRLPQARHVSRLLARVYELLYAGYLHITIRVSQIALAWDITQRCDI